MDMELTGSVNCLAPGVQVGEYRLLGVVGEGGFGIVYRARDLSLDRIVAIKEYMPSTLAGRMSSNQVHVRAQHKGAFDAGLRSFINEARLLAKFSHPALVHVYRFFEENGTAYMVMRYYEGQTFRTFLAEQENGMNEQWLSAMLSPILDVLEMLHAADCFHRDIAPDNVFLQTSGMPVLLDFGAARRIIGDMTQALTMVLKPGFAPIEQYVDDGGMPQGAWTDVYQLGAMLYLAITGKVPKTSVARMISDPIQMLTPTDYPGYSAQFLQGVHRALAVKPLDRPQSIAELKSLLGIRTFTAPAMSAWSASSSAPLDMFSAEQSPFHGQALREATVPATGGADLHVHGATESVAELPSQFEPGVEATASHVKRVAPIVTIPLSVPANLPKEPVPSVPRPDRNRISADVVRAEGPSPKAGESGAKPQKAWPWKSVTMIGALVLVLVGAGFLSSGSSAPDESVTSVSDSASWEAAKKERTVQSLEAYLTAFPTGDHVLEARSTLITLMQASAAAGRTSEVSESLTQKSPEAELAAETKVAAAAAASTAPPAKVDVGAARPALEPAKVEAAPLVLADTKRVTAVEKGIVSLRVSPWGNVRVDRSPVGTTPPLRQLDLSEGQHQIEISNPAGPSVTMVVQVKKGEPVVISHKFE